MATAFGCVMPAAERASRRMRAAPWLDALPHHPFAGYARPAYLQFAAANVRPPA